MSESETESNDCRPDYTAKLSPEDLDGHAPAGLAPEPTDDLPDYSYVGSPVDLEHHAAEAKPPGRIAAAREALRQAEIALAAIDARIEDPDVGHRRKLQDIEETLKTERRTTQARKLIAEREMLEEFLARDGEARHQALETVKAATSYLVTLIEQQEHWARVAGNLAATQREILDEEARRWNPEPTPAELAQRCGVDEAVASRALLSHGRWDTRIRAAVVHELVLRLEITEAQANAALLDLRCAIPNVPDDTEAMVREVELLLTSPTKRRQEVERQLEAAKSQLELLGE